MFSIYDRIIAGRTDEQKNGGFTLIESLLDIGALGTLAAVVIVAVGAMTGQSATDACALDGATVSTAIVAFTTQNPTEVAANLQTDLTATSAVTGGPYLKSWPSNLPHYAFQIDPSSGALEYSDGVIYDAGTGTYTAQIEGKLTTPDVNPDNAPGSANSPWYAYLGPTSCTGAL
jgi:type II secretory pathway pseudopilin PulG